MGLHPDCCTRALFHGYELARWALGPAREAVDMRMLFWVMCPIEKI